MNLLKSHLQHLSELGFVWWLDKHITNNNHKLTANIIGVSTRTIYRWLASGESGAISNLAKPIIRQVKEVFETLSEAIDLEAIKKWLFSGDNKFLGNRKPIDLLAGQETQTVLEAALDLRDSII